MLSTIKTAKTHWQGNLQAGIGKISSSSNVLDRSTLSYSSRFEKAKGTSPEELIASAHSACFSMALAKNLEAAGYSPQQIITEDEVYLEKRDSDYELNKIEIFTEAIVPGLSFKEFLEIAEYTKKSCTMSKALNTEIVLHATLKLSTIDEIIL